MGVPGSQANDPDPSDSRERSSAVAYSEVNVDLRRPQVKSEPPSTFTSAPVI